MTYFKHRSPGVVFCTAIATIIAAVGAQPARCDLIPYAQLTTTQLEELNTRLQGQVRTILPQLDSDLAEYSDHLDAILASGNRKDALCSSIDSIKAQSGKVFDDATQLNKNNQPDLQNAISAARRLTEQLTGQGCGRFANNRTIGWVGDLIRDRLHSINDQAGQYYAQSLSVARALASRYDSNSQQVLDLAKQISDDVRAAAQKHQAIAEQATSFPSPAAYTVDTSTQAPAQSKADAQ